ncbi:hypothetical protein Trydic_g10882 [Trypoxylus dichotomus]
MLKPHTSTTHDNVWQSTVTKSLYWKNPTYWPDALGLSSVKVSLASKVTPKPLIELSLGKCNCFTGICDNFAAVHIKG